MRFLLTICFMSLCSVTAWGQVNPKDGYVVTNEGDTIRGTIDYRTDIINCTQCSFRKDGETAFRRYGPTDICGYRLEDNGAYYVSRTFTIGDKPKTIFAEFLVKGGVSLYHYVDHASDHFFLEGEDGEVARVEGWTEKDWIGSDAMKAGRENLRYVPSVLKKAPDAINELWLKNVNAETLTRLVRQYDETYCTSSGNCVAYQYDAQKTRNTHTVVYLSAEVGLATLSETFDGLTQTKAKLNGFRTRMGVGRDFLLPRFSQNLALQSLVGLNYWKLSERMASGLNPDYTLLALTEQVGVNYTPIIDGSIVPFFRSGLTIEQQFHEKVKDWGDSEYTMNHGFLWFTFGFYAGAGLRIPTGTHAVRLVFDYEYLSHRSSFLIGIHFSL